MAAKDTDDTRNDEIEADENQTVSQSSIKKMIAQAKERGYITYEQLNKALPPEQVSSEQIEDVMSMLSEMGVNVVEDDDETDESDAKGGELVEVSGAREVTVATSSNSETLDRTDDPVRMYLREMGSVELLSREGEIAIAKRIEAGRNTMIAGLCESPLTFQAITIWRDELLNEDVLLRDVIDLETTFGNSLEDDEDVPVTNGLAGSTPSQKRDSSSEPELDADGNPIARSDEDDDEDENANLSLSAMEAALKPRVLDTLDRIAGSYERFGRNAGCPDRGDLARGWQIQRRSRSALPRSAQPVGRDGEFAASAQQPDRGAGRPALRHQQADHVHRQRHGKAGRSGPHQPARIHRRLSRVGAGPDMVRPDGGKARSRLASF